MPESQLKYMIKWFSKNPEDISILHRFYKISGLDQSKIEFRNLPSRSSLILGLEFLNAVEENPDGASDFVTLVGGKDFLLEGKEIKRRLPHTQIVDQAGHAPQLLLEALAQL